MSAPPKFEASGACGGRSEDARNPTPHSAPANMFESALD